MNKITSKYCCIFADNKNRKVFGFKTDEKYINIFCKQYHSNYDKFIKQKLGKAKRENGNSSSNNIDN